MRMPPAPRSAALLLLLALLPPALSTDMLKISEQLDQLDRMEMQEQLRKADGCIQTRDFTCAEAALLKAKKVAKGNTSLAEWTRTDHALSHAKDKVAQERAAALAAEQQRERERLAAEQERERREEERLAAMERDNAVAEMPSPGAQIAAFGALVLQNYANNSAALRAQQLIQQQANAATRERERAAAAERQQRIADERARLTQERASRERRLLAEASAETTRAERAAAEQAAQRERQQRAEETRLRQERETAERLARQENERAASRRELADFHAGMLRGIRLVATKCPDGAGHYYATGSAPRIKEPVTAPACIDVSHEASCPGNQPPIRGIARNFVGMSGCFGDTYQIDPKPSCEVKDVRVKVTSVESCS